MKKYILILLWISPYLLNAQNTNPYNNIIPPNPDAASLAKYADFPVNLSTGVPQINIPLWDIKCGDINVPISLSYHASGSPVAETPSYVGLGWALNAGGAITRTIRGIADDGMFEYPDNGGPSEIPGILKSSSSYAVYPNYPNSSDDYANPSKYRQAAAGKRDLEPDMFYYNFCNSAGKFVFDFNGNPHLIPRKNIIIEKEFSGNRIIKWKITTDDGVKYYFEEIETTEGDTKTEAWTANGANLKVNMISNSHITSEHNSAWFLTKIVMPNSSQSIVFEYDGISQENTYPVSETYKKVNYCAIYGGGTPDNPMTGEDYLLYLSNTYGKNTYEETRTKSTITGKRLRKIIAPDQTVEFIPGDYRHDVKGDKVLDKVVIRNNENEIVKQFKLSYNYFSGSGMTTLGTADPNADPQTDLRLSLKNIQEFDKNAKGLPPYTFEYETSVWLPDRVTSKAQDHWGYYNGRNENTSLIPYLNSIRDVSEGAMKAGSLVKIAYPTGGYTQFNYEANTAFYLNANKTVGGLRIKEKTDYDPVSKKSLFKQYNYNLSGNNSSGYIDYVPVYYYASEASGNFNLGVVMDAGYDKYTSSSNTALNNGGEGIISYQKVTVMEGDDAIGINGKTENEYTLLQSIYSYPSSSTNATSMVPVILWDAHYGSIFPFGPAISGAWGCGLLKSQYIYKYKNNSYYKVKEIQNTYKNDYWGATSNYNSATDVLAAKVGATSTNNGDDYGIGTAAVQFYYIPSRNINVISTTETDYDDNGTPLTSKATGIEYENSSPYIYPSKTTHTLSDGSTLSTAYKYPTDLSTVFGTGDEASLAITSMKSNNIISKPIEIIKYKNDKVIGGNLYEYKNNNNGIPLLNSEYVLQTNSPLDEGAYYESSKFTPCYIGLRYLSLSDHVFYKDNHYEPEINYDSYDVYGNPTQVTTRSGITSYIWGYNQSLPIAKVLNASFNQIAYTGFEDNEFQGWTSKYSSMLSHTNTLSAIGNKSFVLGYISGDILYSPQLLAGTYNVEFYAKSDGNPILMANNKSIACVSSTSLQRYTAQVVLDSNNSIAFSVFSPMYLDEIRICPVGAPMTTYTYAPLVGMTSQTDPNGQTTYYEYDTFGRLRCVKDNKGNIVKSYKYNYAH